MDRAHRAGTLELTSQVKSVVIYMGAAVYLSFYTESSPPRIYQVPFVGKMMGMQISAVGLRMPVLPFPARTHGVKLLYVEYTEEIRMESTRFLSSPGVTPYRTHNSQESVGDHCIRMPGVIWRIHYGIYIYAWKSETMRIGTRVKREGIDPCTLYCVHVDRIMRALP